MMAVCLTADATIRNADAMPLAGVPRCARYDARIVF
jgi:hypothetical protein